MALSTHLFPFLFESLEGDKLISPEQIEKLSSLNPVGNGQSYRFSDGDQNFNGTVFHSVQHALQITFSGGNVSIPSLEGAQFQSVGRYIVGQYDDGFAFMRVTGFTVVGGAIADIEATVLETISFADGGSFTLPNNESDVILGALESVLDPNTDISYEQARAGTGQTLGSSFAHIAYTNAREIVYNLDSKAQVDVALGLLSPNNHALGVIGGSSTTASIITAVARDPNNANNLVVDLATPITSTANNIRILYDVTTEVVRHLIVEGNANAELSNNTLRITAGSGGNGMLEYTGTTPANNEILLGTGTTTQVKGSSITLNSSGRIPYDSIGEADVSLTGSGGSLTINSGNIALYRDRTIFIDHTNTFTIQMAQISTFHDANVDPFFIRVVNRAGNVVAINATVGNTIGGRLTQTLPANEAITYQLPSTGQTNWALLSTSNPLNQFDILQVTTSQSYSNQNSLDMICHRLIEASNTITLSFANSDQDCAFYVHNQGTGTVTLAGLSGVTFNGHTTLEPDDLVWVWDTSATSVYRSELINSASDPVHNAFLDEVVQDGTRFDLSENVFVNADNVIIDTNETGGVPEIFPLNLVPQSATQQVISLGTASGLQFTNLTGGRLNLSIQVQPTSTGGFLPTFINLKATYGTSEFTFPLTNLDSQGGSQVIEITIPNVDYSGALNVSPSFELTVDVTGFRYVANMTIVGLTNIIKGTLHDAVQSIAQVEAMNVQLNLESEIDALRGEINDEDASIEALLPRVSPYQDITVVTPDIYARFLNSTGSDAFPSSVGDMSEVSADNPQFTGNNVALFVATRQPHSYVLKNITQSTELALDGSEPNVTLGESLSFEGFTYFVYRVTGLTASEVYEVDEVRVVQRVEWAGRLNDIDQEIDRIDAVLDNAIFNLDAKTVDWLENDINITEQTTPTIEATEYNKSLGSGGTQKVFYEPNANSGSSGTLTSRPFSELSGNFVNKKLIYFDDAHTFANAQQLWAFDGTTQTNLIESRDNVLYGKKFIPASGGGTVTQKIYPAQSNRVSGEGVWQTLETLTTRSGFPEPLANELFFERNLPTESVTLNIQYRGHANGNLFGAGTTTLAINPSVDSAVTFTISDGSETATAELRWRASQRDIRLSVTERVNSGLATINDIQVILEFDQARTIPPTPASVRDINIGNTSIDRSHVFAVKSSVTSTLILVSDEIEFDTGYAYTTLFGAGLTGHLTIATENGVFLNYENVDLIDTTVLDLENHADLPQHGLFRTVYNESDIAEIDTQMTVRSAQDDRILVGQELVMTAPNSNRYRLSIANDGTLTTTLIT